MLTELRVENLGIVSELCVPIGSGLTAITGETGAGKTLLVDALELLCGGRADPQMVREGATEARVEGRFELDDDDEMILARVVPAKGKSRGYVNGRLATASELAEFARGLVDLHGQHAHQSLLAPAEQRALLDRFAGPKAADALQKLRAFRTRAKEITESLAALGGTDERTRAREVDLLRYQVDEINGAGIVDVTEDAKLLSEETLLASAEEHRDALTEAYRALEGQGEDALGAAVAALAGREPFADLHDRVRALQGEVAEVAHDVRDRAESVVADPEHLAAVQARRAKLREITRKYGPTLADAAAYAKEAGARLAELEQFDARTADLRAEHDRALAAAGKEAAKLSKARHAVAGKLADAVTEHLRTLAMPNARFAVELTPCELTDDGADDVTFLLAPNPGEPARPLAKAASGGELARAMLALRVVLSEAPPTLVFDEVDAGIGGEAGTAVGRALASLGERHQVLCVTHLAQVAAFADAHVHVSKGAEDGRTVTQIELLLDEARVNEISRMLAGDDSSAHARRHAKELLTKSKSKSKARV